MPVSAAEICRWLNIRYELIIKNILDGEEEKTAFGVFELLHLVRKENVKSSDFQSTDMLFLKL